MTDEQAESRDIRDLRVLRTYESLFRAFESLIAGKRFEDITVSELCDAAMVRRATFYSHFADKNDFVAVMLRWIQHASMVAFRNEWKALRASGAMSDRAALVESYVRHSVAQLERHRVLLLELKRSGMYLYLLGFATSADGSAPRLPGNVDSGALGDLLGGLHDGDAGTVDAGLREQFVAGALAQSVMWWLEDGHGIDQESFIKQTAQLILQAVG